MKNYIFLSALALSISLPVAADMLAACNPPETTLQKLERLFLQFAKHYYTHVDFSYLSEQQRTIHESRDNAVLKHSLSDLQVIDAFVRASDYSFKSIGFESGVLFDDPNKNFASKFIKYLNNGPKSDITPALDAIEREVQFYHRIVFDPRLGNLFPPDLKERILEQWSLLPALKTICKASDHFPACPILAQIKRL